MAPGLFTAAFTLGIMMQVVNAFGEVKDAFSVFLYNWTRITELRSIHKRLMEFETAINYNTNKLRKPQNLMKSLMELYIKLMTSYFRYFL